MQHSDATLIFNVGELDVEALQAVRFAQSLGKPNLVAQIDQLGLDEAVNRVIARLSQGKFAIVNIAGPREENRPGNYALTLSVLDRCLENQGSGHDSSNC